MNKRIITNASVSAIVTSVVYIIIGILIFLGSPLLGAIIILGGILGIFTRVFITQKFKDEIYPIYEYKTLLIIVAVGLILLTNVITGTILLVGAIKHEDAVAKKDIEYELATQKASSVMSKIITYTFLTFMALIVIIPFYWMFNTALKTTAEINESITPTLFPNQITFSNFGGAFSKGGGTGSDGEGLNMLNYIGNTLIIALFSTTLGTAISILAAFALARLNFKGKELVFTILLATMMIPGEMMVLSNFKTVSSLGWYSADGRSGGLGSFYSMIIPFLVSIFHIYLLRQTFRQIPNELYYAAKVDGTSDWKYLWKIMVPMAKSSIITITILKIMGAWNAYVWPNLVSLEKYKPITAWLRGGKFRDVEGMVLINEQMAATIMVTLPLLILFVVFRKYIMSGVSRSGIKG